MTRKGAKKGRSVTLPDSWFEEVQRYRRAREWSYEVLGAKLAPFVGEPVPVSTIHAYLKPHLGVTEELTLAIAALTGLQPPPMGEQSSDLDVAALADLARELKLLSPEMLRHQIVVFRSLVADLRARRKS